MLGAIVVDRPWRLEFFAELLFERGFHEETKHHPPFFEQIWVELQGRGWFGTLAQLQHSELLRQGAGGHRE